MPDGLCDRFRYLIYDDAHDAPRALSARAGGVPIVARRGLRAAGKQMSLRRDARVALSAACRRVAAGETVWATWRGERLKLGPFSPEMLAPSLTVLYVSRGRFRVAEIGLRKGSLPCIDMNNCCYFSPRRIRAVVLERHARARQQSA